MSNSLFTQLQVKNLLERISKGEKVVLICEKHPWVGYGSKKPWEFKCPDCTKVQFVGLLVNTPPEKWNEMVEMLEYSVHKLIEADRKGTIDRIKLYKHPKVTIEKDASS